MSRALVRALALKLVESGRICIRIGKMDDAVPTMRRLRAQLAKLSDAELVVARISDGGSFVEIELALT